MKFYLRYCCAMCFALISFLLAPPLSAQAQTREAYVAQSADKTTLTFYYDAQRATRTGTTWGIEERKEEGNVTFPAWAGTNQVADSLTARVVFDASFRDFRPTTTARWFNNYRALKQIAGLEYLNTQNVTNMNKMFNYCSGLTSLDLSHFNTQNVAVMWAMFQGCRRLTSLDLSHFNTQNVTDMGAMFSGCYGLTSLEVSHFNTQNVTYMDRMFSGCYGLPSLDLSHFNTQNVTDMHSMFNGCSGLTSLDVSHFKTQKVTDMSGMFQDCSALTTINSNTAWQCPQSGSMFAGCTKLKGAVPYDQNKTDVTMANPEMGYFTRSNDGGVEAYVAQSADKTTLTFYYDDQRATRTGTTWGIKERKEEGNVIFPAWAGTYQVADSLTARVVFDASFRDFRPFTTARWFCNYRALKQIEGLEYLNTQNVTNMNGMFWFCSGLTSLDLSHFNTQNVTSMNGMFSHCSGLTSLDVSHFNTQNVTDMNGMFYYCFGLTSLDLSHFNTQNVTDMNGMFSDCSGLTSLDLSHFNTQNVTNMSQMFWFCSGLTSLDLSHFNTQNVTDMYGMFSDCSSLTSLDLSHFNTQNVTSMYGMFWFCSGLTSLDVSHFNTQNVTYMNQMFEGCQRLPSLDLKNFNTQNVTDMRSMFRKCSGLPSLDLSHFNTQNVTDMHSMFNGCSGLTSLDVSHFKTQKVTDMSGMFQDCGALTTIKSNTDWQCPQSGGMFAGCTLLKGAVAYDENKTDVTMANPETGYFTRSNGGGVEAYVAQSADKTTLTFYYDNQRATRTGKSWGIEETKEEEDATFPAWAGTWTVADSTTTRVVFDVSFRDFRPTTTARWFNNYRALKQIEGLEYLNTQNVTNMNGMFWFCSGLTSLDVSHFKTQNVTSMYGMFEGCSGLTSLDLSHFNTQNVTDMRYMFQGCSGLTSLDVKNFNTQNVTNMFWMFQGCSALTTINSNTAWQCPHSYYMFAGCTQLKGAVAYDENKIDVTMANPETGYFTRSNDEGVEAYVAQSADKTTLTFYYDDQRATRTGTTWGIEETKEEKSYTFPAWAGTWEVADSTTTRVVFDVSFRDFRPTTTAGWFCNYRALKQIEGLEYLNTQNVTDMDGMFYGCSSLTSLDLSHFNTQNVTYMDGMFEGCSSLTSLDLSHFNTQNVTDMSGMFKGCSGLTSLDVSHFNTQNVTFMGAMFLDCSGLTSLDLSHFNTQNITNMRYMFSGCSGLTSLDLSHFNTQKVTDMRYMFQGCSGLTSLDVKNFNTQNVTNMSGMFAGCSALTTINSNTAWQCPESEDMFAGCTKLKGAVAYDENNTDVTMANPETGYFTAKPTTVESVRFGADDAQHIYTLQGKRVRGAWKHLPAGVYVVNGKKTVKP